MAARERSFLFYDILLLSYLTHTFIPLFLGENADKVPSSASNMMTQILWAGTKYVGCADATTEQSGKECTSSVCYFGKAGNCAWGKYDTWEEAVLSGKACSSTCPSDGTC